MPWFLPWKAENPQKTHRNLGAERPSKYCGRPRLVLENSRRATGISKFMSRKCHYIWEKNLKNTYMVHTNLGTMTSQVQFLASKAWIFKISDPNRYVPTLGSYEHSSPQFFRSSEDSDVNMRRVSSGNMWRKMWIPVLFHVYSNICHMYQPHIQKIQE